MTVDIAFACRHSSATRGAYVHYWGMQSSRDPRLRLDAAARSMRYHAAPMRPAEPSTALLIEQWHDGQADAKNGLVVRLYPELAQIASARLNSEHGTSLSTGDLINDAVLRLMRLEHVDLTDRHHFLALASRIMRNILVDQARARRSNKRHHIKVELCTRIEGDQRFDVAALESALIRLGAIDPQLVELIEMRYFGGMTIDDVAKVTRLSAPTVKRRWQTARAWLMDALMNPIGDD